MLGPGIAWALLAVANAFHIYSGATFLGPRKECYICTEPETIAPWFVWFTSWCLWSTTALFVASRCFARKRGLLDVLVRLALPWSITTTISYSYYLLTTNGGHDMVDDELCYTMSDSAIPRTTPRAAAITFLVFDRISNITAHYVCMVINISIFMSNKELKYTCDRISWLGLTAYACLAIVIALVHSYVDEVYCTDDIWLSIAMSVGAFAVVHGALVFIYWACRRAKSDEGYSDERP